VDGDFADYCTKMRQPSQWGDHITLIALANVLNHSLYIMSHSPDYDVKIESLSSSDRPLLLGHISEVHYVALQPPKDFNIEVLKSVDHLTERVSLRRSARYRKTNRNQAFMYGDIDE
jgi:hypothetical protein